jgi:HK97 family phage prohead protease
MLTAAPAGGLEVRADDDGTVRISGRFPYAAEAQLAPGRFERFEPGAFEFREDVFLLAQHTWDRPLASTAAGSLELRSEPDALSFTATLPAEVAGTSHARDAISLVRSGLASGLSPGFKVAPNGERVERRSDGLLRSISRAQLAELSIVTRAAYPAVVEARSWEPSERPWRPFHPVQRWR